MQTVSSGIQTRVAVSISFDGVTITLQNASEIILYRSIEC